MWLKACWCILRSACLGPVGGSGWHGRRPWGSIALPTFGVVWGLRAGRKKGEEPIKVDDHGMDCLRYMVAHRDVVMGRRASGRGRSGQGSGVGLL